MKDKNGNEIKHGQTLRIRYKFGHGEREYVIDGLYRVYLNPFTGIFLKMTKLFEPKECFVTLAWESGRLCADSRNDRYDHLAVTDSRSNNGDLERHYSNDIEIVKEEEL